MNQNVDNDRLNILNFHSRVSTYYSLGPSKDGQLVIAHFNSLFRSEKVLKHLFVTFNKRLQLQHVLLYRIWC